jgi:hypothetical protein
MTQFPVNKQRLITPLLNCIKTLIHIFRLLKLSPFNEQCVIIPILLVNCIKIVTNYLLLKKMTQFPLNKHIFDQPPLIVNCIKILVQIFTLNDGTISRSFLITPLRELPQDPKSNIYFQRHNFPLISNV